MHSVPISLFLILFVQTTTGELGLPSLPEVVQLLQLETIRGLKQAILEKEGENRRLEEIIRTVEMEKEAVTHNNTMMEEEMMQRIVAMESEKTQMREEFVKKQMERDSSCQDEKRKIEDFKNKQLDEITERLDQSEMTVMYMSEVMLHSNQVMEEQELRPVRIDYQCQDDTNRSFQLFCPGGLCSSRELQSCTDSLDWEEEEVGFEKCQELSFNGASVLCGANGTKETTRRLHIGGGIVEEVVTTPCNDCGDLSSALEWTVWTPCSDETSGRVVEGMLCRRRGNTYIGFEEEEKEIVCAAPWTQLSTGCYRFHESPMTQSEAQKFCEEEQQVPARLIEIESAEENRAIVAEIMRRKFHSQKINFWLGITDRHSEGHWVLESTGKSVVFTDWNSGEPNNLGSGENCAAISSAYKRNKWNDPTGKWKWNDSKCSNNTRLGWMRTALCEKK